MNKKLAIFLCLATSAWAQTQQERIDDINDLLNNQLGPETVIPAIYEYVDFYYQEGYSDGAIVDYFGQVTTGKGEFAKAFGTWQKWLVGYINDLLKRCDSRGMRRSLEFLDFYNDGYSDGSQVLDEQAVERSEEFGEAYRKWKDADTLRERLRGGGPDQGFEFADLSGLLAQLRNAGSHDARLLVAQKLGSVQPSVLARAVDWLAGLLSDPDKYVRSWAASSLGRLGNAAGSAAPALISGLQDHSRGTARECAAALALIVDLRTDRGAAQAIEAAFHDEDAPLAAWPTRRR